jgi:hypothetical protein
MKHIEHRESEPVPEGFTAINNCPMAFECPKTWASLTPTENADVRHCDSCSKDVTFCSEEVQLERMTEAGACVAFYVVRNGVARVLTGSVARKPGEPRRDDQLRAFIDSF